MSVKVLMPKPTIFDYLIPGLINIRSRRFISTGVLSILAIIISLNTILRSKNLDTLIFYICVLVFLYTLNYFVCIKQSKNINLIGHRLSEIFLLYIYIILIRIPFAFFTIFLVYKINTQVTLAFVIFWVITSQFFISFLYFFEMHFAGFKPKYFVRSYGRDIYLYNIIKKYHPYGQTGGITSATTFIQLKICDKFTNGFFTKYIKNFNDNKTEITLKNSLLAALLLTVSDYVGWLLFILLISLVLLTSFYLLILWRH